MRCNMPSDTKPRSNIGAVVEHSTPHFTRVELNNFRGCEHVALDDLAPVSILTGANGSGKTTFLEAIWLLAGLTSAGLIEPIARARGLVSGHGSDLMFTTIFMNMNPENEAELIARQGSGETAVERRLTISAIERPAYLDVLPGVPRVIGLALRGSILDKSYRTEINWQQAGDSSSPELVPLGAPDPSSGLVLAASPWRPHDHWIHAAYLRPMWRAPGRIAELVSDARRRRTHRRLVDLLRLVEPRVVDVEALPNGSGFPVVYVDLGNGPLLPAPVLGSGFCNFLDIAVWMAIGEARIVLIDEIEDGLHYTVLPKIAEALIKLVSERGIQVFVTTHSKDAVQAFALAGTEHPNSVVFYNLVRSREGHEAVRYTVEEVSTLLKIGSDVR
ncbi:MAG: AAA family ATPase [Geminicoccaceae bacterium]|nr:AAA family ATPase [Geminicoccaceae bacterium]